MYVSLKSLFFFFKKKKQRKPDFFSSSRGWRLFFLQRVTSPTEFAQLHCIVPRRTVRSGFRFVQNDLGSKTGKVGQVGARLRVTRKRVTNYPLRTVIAFYPNRSTTSKSLAKRTSAKRVRTRLSCRRWFTTQTTRPMRATSRATQSRR